MQDKATPRTPSISDSPIPDRFSMRARDLLQTHPNATDEAIATLIFDTARTRNDVVDLMRPLAVLAVAHSRRRKTFHIERAVLVDLPIPLSGTPGEIARLLTETFAVPGRFRVTWGDASVEQLRERANYERRQAQANLHTALQCEWVIRYLESVGARCLNEAPPSVASTTTRKRATALPKTRTKAGSTSGTA